MVLRLKNLAVWKQTLKLQTNMSNGTRPLRNLLGDDEPREFTARFIWLNEEQEGISDEGVVSWYDSRRNQPHRSAEYRLYYKTNAVSEIAQAGDTLIIAHQADDTLLIIVASAGTTIQRQLLWLFGVDEQLEENFVTKPITAENSETLDFAARYILDELGIEFEEPEADKLDGLLERFGNKFPTTKEFSELARLSLKHVSPMDNADAVIMAWIEQEELLFRRLERRIVDERLRSGFMNNNVADVDGFIKFSLSVQNRRKSRAGLSLENHLETLFNARALHFSRGTETENRHKPDFLFPGQGSYRDEGFPAERLTLLGAKSTLKDRWRQVLAEARRIEPKHLITLEPGISQNQTEQMKASNLQLVVPSKLQETYLPAQQSWLMNLEDFMLLVRQRQDP